MNHFAHPWVLLLIVLIPFLWWRARRGGRSGSILFSDCTLVSSAAFGARTAMRWLPDVLRALALILLIVALARPQEGVEQVRESSEGVAMMMVVDRSSSMGIEMRRAGGSASRLSVVKEVFRQFVVGDGELSGRPHDLIGLVSFARYADTLCPLTLSHDALVQFVDYLEVVNNEAEDGTAIGDALALAAARLHTAEKTLTDQGSSAPPYAIRGKVIVLLTDGQNNAGSRSPFEAAELAKEWGITVHAIGVGGAQGFVRQQGVLGGFLVAAGGGVDKTTLKGIASRTGGIFRIAEDAESLRDVYEEIDALEKTRFEATRFIDYRERFPVAALAALALLALECMLRATILRVVP